MTTLKIAKIVGIIGIVIVLFGLLVIILALLAQPSISTNIFQLLFTFGSMVLVTTTSFGLIKGKRWAVYLYFISTLLPILKHFVENISSGKSLKLAASTRTLSADLIPNVFLATVLGYIIFAIFTIIQMGFTNLLGLIVSYYFYRNRDKFE